MKSLKNHLGSFAFLAILTAVAPGCNGGGGANSTPYPDQDFPDNIKKTCMEPRPDFKQNIRFGDVACIKKAIEQGARVNDRDSDGDTALHRALDSSAAFFAQGKPDVLKVLVEAGASVNLPNAKGDSPLHLALGLESKYSALADYLITLSAVDVEQKNAKGNSPLHLAITNGFVPQATAIVARGADLSVLSSNGFTALNHAIVEKYPELAIFMIQKGADINQSDSTAGAPLHNALTGRFNDVAKELILRRAKLDVFNYDGDTPLNLSIRTLNREIFDLLVRSGASLEATTRNNDLPLHIALKVKGAESFAKSLIERKVSVTQTDSGGNAPIHLATLSNSEELVDLLLKKGATADQVNSSGQTALFLVKSASLAQRLLSAGANPNIGDNALRAPLYFAIESGNAELVNLFIRSGADYKWRDGSFRNYLHHAIRSNSLPAAVRLIELGLDVNGRDRDGNTPLFEVGTPDAIRLLASHGADFNMENAEGLPPLRTFVGNGFMFKEPMVTQMVQSGANVRWVDAKVNRGFGRTYLFTLVQKNSIALAQLFIDKGVEVNRQDIYGNSVLHFVQSPEAVRQLAQAGIEVNLRNKERLTALGVVENRIKQFQKFIDDAIKSGNDALIERAKAQYEPEIQRWTPVADAIREAGGRI